jgi:cytochrome P450
MTNPIAYKRLQEEIDELGDDVYDSTKLAHLPYLNGAINETLRLLPPVLIGSHREPEKGSGGKMLGSYFLPEGNSTFIPTYSLQRDPRCFSPLPDTFLPERWLPETMRKNLEPKIFSSKEGYIHNTTAFIPFSLGPMNCAGKNLALLEMRMSVALMVHKLNFTLQKGYDSDRWEMDIKDHFVTSKGALPAVVTVRNH